MPPDQEFTITDPETGRTITYTGPAPPSDEEIDALFAADLQKSRLQLPRHGVPNPTQFEQPTGLGESIMRNAQNPLDSAVDALPAVGGTVGGVLGGAGGTAFGLGFGGLPGAVGGATLGASGGEALRQLIQRARGQSAPATPLEAATDIGKTGAISGATELVGGKVAPALMGRAMRYAPDWVLDKKIGQELLESGTSVSRGGQRAAREGATEAGGRAASSREAARAEWAAGKAKQGSGPGGKADVAKIDALDAASREAAGEAGTLSGREAAIAATLAATPKQGRMGAGHGMMLLGLGGGVGASIGGLPGAIIGPMVAAGTEGVRRALKSPEAMSKAAIMLDKMQMMGATPALARAALLRLFESDEDDAGTPQQ